MPFEFEFNRNRVDHGVNDHEDVVRTSTVELNAMLAVKRGSEDVGFNHVEEA